MDRDGCRNCRTLDAICNGIAVIDAQKRIRVWNDWMVRHSGIAVAAAIGRHYTALWPEIGNTRLAQAIDSALAHRLACLVTPSLNPCLLPLFKSAADRTHGQRLTQLIHVTPIVEPDGVTCLLQIQDVSSAVKRERLLRDQSTDLAARNLQLSVQLAEIQELQAKINLRDRQDELTGVLNRKHLEKLIHASFKQEGAQTLILVSLDQIRRIVDVHGLGASDAAIQALARVLKRHLPKDACVGRFESDEFLVLLPETPDDKVRSLVERWRDSFRKSPPQWAGQSIAATFSAGTVDFPRHGKSLASLIECLDLTIFIGKDDGGNRLVFYDEALKGEV